MSELRTRVKMVAAVMERKKKSACWEPSIMPVAFRRFQKKNPTRAGAMVARAKI